MSVRQRIDSTGKRYWTYRKTVRLPSGKKRRISGRSSINTKAAAENAERAAIELLLNPRPEPEEAGPTPTVAEFAPFFLENHKPDQKPSQ